jgi:hypothetical protein
MDPEVVNLKPRSRAEAAALAALVDLGDLLAEANIAVSDTRVIGGHMVALHVERHGLDHTHLRMTADSDFGLDMSTLRRLNPIESFEARGYKLRDGHRFYRAIDGEPEHEAIIDVLIPSYRSGPGSTRALEGLITYQTPGLAELLRHDPMLLRLRVESNRGETRETLIATTDERGALFSKVLAWGDRSRKSSADKDAFDVWRCLEVCERAKVQPSDWPEHFEGSGWTQILRRDFSSVNAPGCRAIASYVGTTHGRAQLAVTRTHALVAKLMGR